MGENTACQYIKCTWGKITLVNTNNTCQYIYFADHVHEKARIWSRQNTSDTILFWLNVNTFISQITCKNSQNLVQTQYVWHHSVLIVSRSDCNFCNGVAEIGGQIFPSLPFFFPIFFIFVADNIILHFKFSLLYHRNKLVLVSQINYNWTEPLFLFPLVQRADIFHTMITDQPDVN